MFYNVLVVEDDRQTATSLAQQIRVLGHTVGIALGPRTAMRHLSQVIPDVIMLDINMPGVNGLEVLGFLRRDPLTAGVPVIIISANDSPAIIRSALDSGANHYLIKPPTLEQIEAALERVMRHHAPPCKGN